GARRLTITSTAPSSPAVSAPSSCDSTVDPSGPWAQPVNASSMDATTTAPPCCSIAPCLAIQENQGEPDLGEHSQRRRLGKVSARARRRRIDMVEAHAVLTAGVSTDTGHHRAAEAGGAAARRFGIDQVLRAVGLIAARD